MPVSATLRLSNLRVSTRIVILCLVPLLGLLGFLAAALPAKWQGARSADRVLLIIETAPLISNLVHELQRERGASAGFVASKGQSLADVMHQQRPASDKAIAIWREKIEKIDRSLLGEKLARTLDEAKTALASISNMRTAVDSLTIDGPHTIAYFTSIIGKLLAAGEGTAKCWTPGSDGDCKR